MFDFEDDASTREKCFTTVAELPTFVNLKQIPAKKAPFSTIFNYPFVHTVRLPNLSVILDDARGFSEDDADEME